MTALREGALEYQFGETWTVSKYDEWPFYREHFERAFGGSKAVDVLAHEPNDTLWLIELKDYRVHAREKTLELAEEVALRVRDSLAGLVAAAKWHGHHAYQETSQRFLNSKKLRVVLHLEQPQRQSKLFPREFDLSKLQQRLKQLVRVVDAHPAVVELAAFKLPWSAAAVSGEQP